MKDLGFNYYSSPIHAHCSSGGLSRKMVISFHEVIVPETDSAHIEEPQMWTDHSEVNVCPCVWSSTMTTTIVLPLLNYSKSLCRSLQVVNFQRCELAPVCQLFDYTIVLFQVLFCKIKKCFLYFVFVCFLMYYLWENYYKPIMCVYMCSVMSNLVTLRKVVSQAPLSMGFSRQEYWSGLPFPPPWDLPDSGI